MGTTSDKLTYLNTTKSNLKDMINYGLDNNNKITNQTTFRNYVSSTFKAFIESLNNPNTLWGNLPKITGEGKKITLNNTIEAPMKLELNSTELEQVTTTGKNITNIDTYKGGFVASNGVLYENTGISNYTNQNGEITFTTTETYKGTFSDYIVIEANTKYILSYNALTAGVSYFGFYNWYDEDKTFISRRDISASIANSPSNAKYLVIFIGITTAGTASLKEVQVELGSTATSYEPYTGRIASPNPSYSQQIHTISGDNEIVVQNKNLFDKNNVVQGYIRSNNGTINPESGTHTSDYINILPNTNYIRTTREGNAYYDKNKAFISYYYGESITTPSNAKYLRMSVNDNYLNDEQLEKGSTPTSYIEHKEQNYSITLGNIEYTKIGDYADKIDKSSGKNLFDGSITPELYSYNSSGVKVSDTDLCINQELNNIDFSSIYISFSSIVGSSYVRICEYNSSGTFIKRTLVNTNQSLTLDNNTKKLIFSVNASSTKYFTNLMINEGSTALPYEPYGNGLWYIKKNIGKVVLDGTENWLSHAYGTNSYSLQNYINFIFNNQAKQIITDYFKGVPNSDRTSGDNIIYTISNMEFVIRNTTFTSSSDFKTWLSTHNTNLYYQLATPTYTILNDTLQTQLEDIYNTMKSYNGQTNISQVNNDLAFNISSSAIEDIIG